MALLEWWQPSADASRLLSFAVRCPQIPRRFRLFTFTLQTNLELGIFRERRLIDNRAHPSLLPPLTFLSSTRLLLSSTLLRPLHPSVRRYTPDTIAEHTYNVTARGPFEEDVPFAIRALRRSIERHLAIDR